MACAWINISAEEEQMPLHHYHFQKKILLIFSQTAFLRYKGWPVHKMASYTHTKLTATNHWHFAWWQDAAACARDQPAPIYLFKDREEETGQNK